MDPHANADHAPLHAEQQARAGRQARQAWLAQPEALKGQER